MSKARKQSRDVWCDHCSYRFTTQVNDGEGSVNCLNCGKATLLVHCSTCGNDAELAEVNFEKGNWVCPTCKEYRDFSAETLTDFLSAQIGIDEPNQPRRRRGRPTFRGGCITLIVLYFLANIMLSSCGDLLASTPRSEVSTPRSEVPLPTRPTPTATAESVLKYGIFREINAQSEITLPTGHQLAYISDAVNADRQEIRIHDVGTKTTRWAGRLLTDQRITQLQWLPESKNFFYRAATQAPYETSLVRTHELENLGEFMLVSERETLATSNVLNQYRIAALSRDESMIAYVTGSDSEQEAGMHLLDLATGTTQLIFEGRVESVAWSPDSTRIAFSIEVGVFSELQVYTLESGETVRWLGGVKGIRDVAWSPDGDSVIYVRDNDVYSADASQTEQLLVAFFSFRVRTPIWTPDGKYVMFSADIDGDFDLYIFDPENPRYLARLINTPHNERYPVWRP